MSEEFDKRLSPRDAVLKLKQISMIAVDDVRQKLAARGAKARSGADDDVFRQFNTSLAVGLGSGLASYYVDLVHEVDKVTLAFEQAESTKVHKGSIYFNLAVLCLYKNDFDGALHYFHAADFENRETHGSSALFSGEKVFASNVTDRLKMLFKQEYMVDRTTIDQLFGGKPSDADIDTVFAGLPHGQFDSFIVTGFRYAMARTYAEDNDGTRTLYHRLLTDFCHCFEAGLKDHLGRTAGTLGDHLGALQSTAVGNLTGEINTIRGPATSTNPHSWKCTSVPELNTLVDTHDAIGQIERETDQLKALAKLFALVHAVRNQVAHDLDLQNSLCKDVSKGRRVLRWMLFSVMFPAYL